MFQAKCVCFYKLGYTGIGPHAKLKCMSQGKFEVLAQFTFIFSVCITVCTSLTGCSNSVYGILFARGSIPCSVYTSDRSATNAANSLVLHLREERRKNQTENTDNSQQNSLFCLFKTTLI